MIILSKVIEKPAFKGTQWRQWIYCKQLTLMILSVDLCGEVDSAFSNMMIHIPRDLENILLNGSFHCHCIKKITTRLQTVRKWAKKKSKVSLSALSKPGSKKGKRRVFRKVKKAKDVKDQLHWSSTSSGHFVDEPKAQKCLTIWALWVVVKGNKRFTRLFLET